MSVFFSWCYFGMRNQSGLGFKLEWIISSFRVVSLYSNSTLLYSANLPGLIETKAKSELYHRVVNTEKYYLEN